MRSATAESGHLYGVGVGPGDPGLITRRAAELIASAEVVVYHAGTGRTSNARAIAAELIPAEAIEEELRYPVTTGAATVCAPTFQNRRTSRRYRVRTPIQLIPG